MIMFDKLSLSECRKLSRHLSMQLGCVVLMKIDELTVVRYVALSPNDKTGFRARELKSIHVDAVGCFVKFVIHKNHINKHNSFNQVSSLPLCCCMLLCVAMGESFRPLSAHASRPTCYPQTEGQNKNK